MIESYKNFNALMYIATGDLLNEDFVFAQSFHTSETTVSKTTKRKVLRRIKNYDKATLWNELPFALKRIVAMILIVSTVSMWMCFSVKAVREAIVSTVLEWYDEFVAIFYVTEATLPSTIQVYKEPRLSLSGTERLITLKVAVSYQIFYMRDGEILMSYQQDVIRDTSYKIDSENNCKQTKIAINGHDALMFVYDDGHVILKWHDNQYTYLISVFTSEIEISTLISIAESVQ